MRIITTEISKIGEALRGVVHMHLFKTLKGPATTTHCEIVDACWEIDQEPILSAGSCCCYSTKFSKGSGVKAVWYNSSILVSAILRIMDKSLNKRNYGIGTKK